MYKFKASFTKINGKTNNKYLKISIALLNFAPNIKDIKNGARK